jgi:hypothetical protein
LIALQYHDVRVTLKFREALACVNYEGTTAPSTMPSMADSYLLIDYVYLDSEERKRFAQASHEYLIEQLQFTGSESLTASSNKYRLNFNHPSKYLIWAPHLERHNKRNTWVAYAFNNDWDAAKERFSKLVWAAARLTSATQITLSGTEGDLEEPATTTTTALNDKVEAKIVNTVGNAAQTVSLDDIVLVRSDVTMEDMSNTVDELADLFGSANVTTYLNANCYSVINYHNYANFVDGSDNPVINGKLQLNGHDRFQARDGNYFNYVQPHQHFSNTPADGINVYSFALKAEEHQPSGTCNFSRIDNATLQVDCGLYNASSTGYVAKYIGTNSNSLLNIYTVNYNVLRVMSLCNKSYPYSIYY